MSNKTRTRPVVDAPRSSARPGQPRCKNVTVLVSPEPRPATAPGFPMLANLCLAALLLGIVTAWFWMAPPNPEAQLGYLLLAATTTILALLALVRPPARNCDERWWVYLLCLSSLGYTFAYRFDTRNGMALIFWGRVALQFLANLWMLSLGQSYGMLPALREVRTRLLYRYIRHPAYAMYLLADVAVVCLQPSFWNAGVALTGLALFTMRARLEERVLCHDAAYHDYMARVRWRFLPGVL